MTRRTCSFGIAGVVIGATLAGCASGVSAEKDELEAAKTAQSALSFPDLVSPVPRISGTPTQIYTRIARGAVTCWFGAHGSLRATHVYSAVAKPPSQGGQARILIHKKDTSLPDKRGARAYAIDIVPDGKTAKLEIQNAQMGEPRGTNMTSDARRWAAGQEGCVAKPVALGWDAEDKSKRKAKAKPKTKAKPSQQASKKKPK